jgi:uncharacterized membrane protein YfcA
MPSLPLAHLAWIAFAVFLGGALRGFTGFGFAIAATPLLSLVLAPAQAVAMVMLLGVGIGLTDLRTALTQSHWTSVAPLAAGMAVATPLGVLALALLSAAHARLAIALVLVAATAILVSGFRFRRLPGRLPAAGLGALSGLFNGLAAMPGPPVIAYCLALPLPIAGIRATMMLYFLSTSIVGLTTAFLSRLVGPAEALGAVTAFPALFVGVRAGAFAFRHATERAYRLVSLLALTGLTLVVVARSIADLMG